MPAEIQCPGCGWKSKVPENLMGKRLRCKRCNRSFVAGGRAVTPRASDPELLPTSSAELDFGGPEIRAPVRRTPKKKSKRKPLLILFFVGFLLGAGGVGAYLYVTRPEPIAATNEKTADVRFSWIVKSK